MPADAFDLTRFVRAQEVGAAYEAALRELRAGRKETHWMWFVFPQLRGLGRSATAKHYAISGLEEARAYAAHPVLGPRLRACAEALTGLPGRNPVAVLGETDAQKLRSCLTLFLRAVPDEPVLGAVLDQYYDGVEDEQTIRLLGDQGG